MKPGDLVKFKVHHYHKSYGVGILLGRNPHFGTIDDTRYWAMFNNERIMVRLNELELISESG